MSTERPREGFSGEQWEAVGDACTHAVRWHIAKIRQALSSGLSVTDLSREQCREMFAVEFAAAEVSVSDLAMIRRGCAFLKGQPEEIRRIVSAESEFLPSSDSREALAEAIRVCMIGPSADARLSAGGDGLLRERALPRAAVGSSDSAQTLERFSRLVARCRAAADTLTSLGKEEALEYLCKIQQAVYRSLAWHEADGETPSLIGEKAAELERWLERYESVGSSRKEHPVEHAGSRRSRIASFLGNIFAHRRPSVPDAISPPGSGDR